TLTTVPSLPICGAETVSVPLLILRFRAESRVVAGISGFELTLPLESPALIGVAILAAGGMALVPPAFIAGHVGIGEASSVPVAVPSTGSGHLTELTVFGARQTIVTIPIQLAERRDRIAPFVARNRAVVVHVQIAETLD